MPAKKTTAKQGPPPEATPHQPKDHWLASEINRERLDAILQDPVFLAATHYVMEENRVRSSILTQEAMPDSVIARRASVHAGCIEFVTNLRNLVHRKSIPYEPEPYGHIDKSPHLQ